MISNKMNKNSKISKASDSSPHTNTSTSSPNTQALSIQTLNSLLVTKLKFHLMRVLQSPSYTKKVLLTLILSIFQKSLKKILKTWDFESKKTKNFLSGLSILQKHQKNHEKHQKTHEKQPKKKLKISGFQEIQQERALNKLRRIINRKKFEFKRDVFGMLIKNWYYYSRVFRILKDRPQVEGRKVMRKWKAYVESRKSCRLRALVRFGRLGKVRLWESFCRIVEENCEVRLKSGKLAVLKVQKVGLVRIRKGFDGLVRKWAVDLSLRGELLGEKLKELKNSRLREGFLCVKRKYLNRSVRKLGQGLNILKSILLKRCYHTLSLIKFTSIKNDPIKLLMFTEHIKPLELKTKQFALSKLKSCRNPKLYQFPTKIIFNKLHYLIKKRLKPALSSLKTHKNLIRFSYSLKCLSYFIHTQQFSHKKSVFKALKSISQLKKQQRMLWKMKFYQLEGLIQHKNEEFSLKLKVKHFYQWKNNSKLLSKQSKKQTKQKTKKFFNVLSSTLHNLIFVQRLKTFSFVKQRFLQEKKSLWRLDEVYSKCLKQKYLEKMKKKALSALLSPNSMRRSAFGFGSSQRKSSPYLPSTRMSSPGLPRVKNNANTRFAFYSTKKSSLDNVTYKHNGIVKMLHLSDKGQYFEKLLK